MEHTYSTRRAFFIVHMGGAAHPERMKMAGFAIDCAKPWLGIKADFPVGELFSPLIVCAWISAEPEIVVIAV